MPPLGMCYRTVENIADMLTVLKDPQAYGKHGGVDRKYVGQRIGRSVRTVERYLAMVRADAPVVAWAKKLI